ncbi:peptidase S51 [Brunnivagina elsteri CCALA 953]|uniref:Peptidase S51 n=2 Tax=Brunnivagina TaxID=3344733 RepID=A0A2A2TN84_9CYAN|nr:peptidase S51 [Calothrix elsteri CCALA 953]
MFRKIIFTNRNLINPAKSCKTAAITFITASFIIFPAIATAKPYLKGNPANVNPPLAGAVYNLGGGGTDVDGAIQWMINNARGCEKCSSKVDVVIIRAAGSDAYNQPISEMDGVDSVETLVITSKSDANTPSVVEAVKNAEVIFFAGGDQCKYVENFQNTKLEKAVESVSARGGAVGGTSAGAMIQSDFVYNSCLSNIESRDALDDPYRDIDFTYNFLPWVNLKYTVVDTHFDKRDRMGRLMAFTARQVQDGKAKSALGIGVSEATSVVVDRNGIAKVIGKGSAYFVLADHLPKVCEKGKPLSYADFKIWKVNNGETFNLRNYPQKGYYLRSVDRGRIDSNPY